MQITITGAVALLVALIFMLKRPDWLFYAGLFLATFSGTAVLNIPSAEFGLPVSVFMFFCYGLALVLHGKLLNMIRFGPSQIPPVLQLLTFILVLLLTLWGPVMDGTLVRVNTTMLIYVCINTGIALLTVWTLKTERELLRALKVQGASVIFVSAWGYFQFASRLIGIPYPDWLFNNSGAHFAQNFGAVATAGIVRVGSVAVEPSILVQSLSGFVAVAATLLVRGRAVLGRAGVVALAAGFVCMVVSTSTTGYVGLAVLAVFLMLQSTVRSTGLLLGLTAASLALLAIEPRLLKAVLESTIDKSSSWSFDKRTGSITAGLELFLERPLLGWGWATKTVNSMPVFLLANTGLIGTSVFVFMLSNLFLILFGCAYHYGDRPKPLSKAGLPEGTAGLPLGDIALGLLNALAVSLVMQSVAGFTYVFPDFWILTGLTLSLARLAGETRMASRSVEAAAWPYPRCGDEAPHPAPALLGSPSNARSRSGPLRA